jgi:pimeloyl-ACP methyl ester carboxylesterase
VGEADHLHIETNGIRMHAVVQGQGPAVLFCHGFPGLWYSWRHQLPVVADAGFKAIAVDMRGYGRTDRPLAASEYGNQIIVGDLTGLLDALGEERAVFVGHDFGAQAAWAAALHAPDHVRGVVSVGVPYGVGFASDKKKGSRPKSPKPSDTYAKIAESHFLHLHYFQKVGPPEAELGMPWPWLSEEDLDYLVEEYMRPGLDTAFIGGLNSYRAMDINWEQDPDYGRAKINCPTLFLCGEKDPVLQIVSPKSLETMPNRLTDLRGIELIPNAGHFAQQEQPKAVNKALLRFLATLE